MVRAAVQSYPGGSRLVTLSSGKATLTLLFYGGGNVDGLGKVDVLVCSRDPGLPKLKFTELWLGAPLDAGRVAALRAAAKLAPDFADRFKAVKHQGKVRHFRPGDAPWTTKKLPGVRIRAVAAAVDDQLARGFIARLNGTDDELVERLEPFEAEHRMDLEQLRAMATDASHADVPLAAFFREHYFGGEEWRHIDQLWLDDAQGLAPTAPVLEIELEPGGETLRF